MFFAKVFRTLGTVSIGSLSVYGAYCTLARLCNYCTPTYQFASFTATITLLESIYGGCGVEILAREKNCFSLDKIFLPARRSGRPALQT